MTKYAPAKKYVRCAECGRVVALMRDGTLWQHEIPRGSFRTAVCPGSRTRPPS